MSRFLAIDADAGGLFVATGTIRGGGVQLERAFAVLDEVPANLSAANATALGSRLKLLLKEAKIAPAPVLLCFGRDRVIIKDVKFPPVAPNEEAAIVRFQAQKDLADSADDVVMDYFTLPNAPGEIQHRATVVFLRRELYAAAQEFCTAAGLKLAAVTARPFATIATARRAIATGATLPPDDPAAPIAVLSLWGTGGEFAVGQGNQTLFSRTISSATLGNDAMFLGEVKRSLASFNSQTPGKPVQVLYLAEGNAAEASWIDRLQTSLGLPVHPLDPLAGSKGVEGVPVELHGRFLGPVGMLATKTTGEKLGINFQAPRAPRSAPDKTKRRLMAFGALAAVLLACTAGFLYLQLKKAERDGVQLAQDKTDLEERAKGQIVETKRADAAAQFVSRQVPWLDIYYDLNSQFPTLDRLRLLEFEGKVVALTPVKVGAVAPKPPVVVASATSRLRIKPGEKPIGKITLTMLGEDTALPEKLKDTLNKEPAGYANAQYTGGALVGGSGSKVSQFTINADLYPRRPAEFTRKLAAPPAPKPTVIAPKEEEPVFDPFSGGGQ